MQIANVLHDQISKAGINVVGVSIGRKDDKRTWRIDLADESQRAQAEALVAAFDHKNMAVELPMLTLEQRVAALEAKAR